MADKLLKYDVAMKSTKTVWQMETPRCYTGDENTVTFDFNITDLEAADLVGVIPNVYLYMRDGSFFQNGPADGVEITGTIVNYTMKGNEGKHSGIARAQLVLVWDDEINPPEKLTSQLYDFEVVSGLENKVAVEVMIQDWTTLTREARTFIDTSSDEVDALKGELQTAINTANASLGEFDVALETGIVAANLAEKLEDFEEINNSRLLSTERQLAEAENLKKPIISNTQKVTGLTHIMAGIDSLTNGAGSTAWSDYFRPRIQGELGMGGLGFVGFHNTTIQEFGTWNIAGMSGLDGTDQSLYPGKYSLDNKGLYCENGDGTTPHIWCYFTDKNFKHAKLIYLKQPGGGSFKVGYVNKTIDTYITVDTSNADFDLGVIDLEDNVSPNNGQLSITAMTGKIAVFGYYLYNDSGCIFTKLGKGGDTLVNHAKTDSAFRAKWLDVLKPDYYMANLGVNDKESMSDVVYDTTIRSYLQPFLDKSTQIIMVRPNDISGDTKLDAFNDKIVAFCKEKRCGYINEKSLLGSYSEANSLGYMVDTVHPSVIGNKKRTDNYLNYFGIPKLGLNVSLVKDTTSGTAATYQHKTPLSSKYLRSLLGVQVLVYKIGLTNAYPAGRLRLNIVGQRTGTNGVVEKEIFTAIGNSTTVNRVSLANPITSITKFVLNPDGIPTDFIVTTAIVSNLLEVYVTPNIGARDMTFYIEGEIILPTLANLGKAVFEN